MMNLKCWYIACLLISTWAAHAQDVVIDVQPEEWIRKGKAELVYGKAQSSFSALYVTESAYFFYEEIEKQVLQVGHDGLVQKVWNVRQNVPPFFSGSFYLHQPNILHFATLSPKRSFLVFQLGKKASKTLERVPLHADIKAISLAEAKSIRFGQHTITYNAQYSPGIRASLYANSTVRLLQATGHGNLVGMRPKKELIDPVVMGEELFVLDNWAHELLVFDQQLQIKERFPLPETFRKDKQTQPNYYIWTSLLPDAQTGKLYLQTHTGKGIDIFVFQQGDFKKIMTLRGEWGCFQIFGGYMYFLLPAERIQNPEHLERHNLFFNGRYNYVYRMKMEG